MSLRVFRSSTPDEVPVGVEVLDSPCRVTGPFVHGGQVVLRIGEPRREFDRLRIGRYRPIVVAEVVVGDADVEVRRGIVRIDLPGGFVVIEGISNGACCVFMG